jgi:SAM-dependent methyltransferase
LDIDKHFDLILMSESSNYFPLNQGFKQSKRYLKRGGYLLVCGIFRRNKTKQFEEDHVYADFLKAASEVGLTVTYDTDITAQVTPTLDIAHEYYHNYVVPFLGVIDDYYRAGFTLKYRLLSWLFKKEIKVTKNLLFELMPKRLSSREFTQYITYRSLLFKKT